MKHSKKKTYNVGGKLGEAAKKAVKKTKSSSPKKVVKFKYGGKKKIYKLGGSISTESPQQPPHEVYLSEIQKNPTSFRKKMEEDESFRNDVLEAFSSEESFNTFSNFRTKHFVSQGKATVSSPKIKEIAGGVRVSNEEEYKSLIEKYPDVNKVVSYSTETDDDASIQQMFKTIQKNHWKKKQEPQQMSEELLEMRRAAGIED
jgi:hypothetical protein